jgi:tetratricopeptide (TPR) repeat protein
MEVINFPIPKTNVIKKQSHEIIDISESYTNKNGKSNSPDINSSSINITNKNTNMNTEIVKMVDNVYYMNANMVSSNLVEDNLDIENIPTQKIYENAEMSKFLRNKIDAMKWYKIYVEREDIHLELAYEAYINLGIIATEMTLGYQDVSKYYLKAIDILPDRDRAEPFYYLALHANKNKKYEIAYSLLCKAMTLDYDSVKDKYKNKPQKTAYGIYLLDELSVACYWLKKYDEGKKYLEKILYHPDFVQSRSRLNQNLMHFNEAIITPTKK